MVDAAFLSSRLPLQADASPLQFDSFASRLVPWLAFAAAVLALAAFAIGVWAAPADPGIAGAYPIMFIHIPAAWLSLALFVLMAVTAAASLSLDTPIAARLMRALAPVGALFALAALVTGVLWGTSEMRTSWLGDARFTCELILLALFSAVPLLHSNADETVRAEMAAAVLVIVGALNLPIIYFSVNWWNAAHERAATTLVTSAGQAGGMVIMATAFTLYAAAAVLARLRTPRELS